MPADAAPRTAIEEQAQHRLAATKLVPEQMFVWHVLRPSTLQISRWAHACTAPLAAVALSVTLSFPILSSLHLLVLCQLGLPCVCRGDCSTNHRASVA